MKKAIILQGLPGSGKTTWAESYSINDDVSIISTDDFFTVNGEYVYDPLKAQESHESTFTRWQQACWAGRQTLILSNTNTTRWEMSPYVMLAKISGYEVSFYTFECSVAASLKRNVHGVPSGTVSQMAKDMEKPLPFWGEHVTLESDWLDTWLSYRQSCKQSEGA